MRIKLCFFLVFSLFGFASDTKLQIRAGYFDLKDHRAREIYNNGGIEVEIEAARKIGCYVDLWGNFNYFWKNGHSTGLKEKTHLDLYTLSLGLKHFFPLYRERLYFYLGIGGALGILKIKDNSSFVKKHRDQAFGGGVAKGGFLYFFKQCFFFDFFTDYYYLPSHFKGSRMRNLTGNNPDLGGFRFGLGFGVNF